MLLSGKISQADEFPQYISAAIVKPFPMCRTYGQLLPGRQLAHSMVFARIWQSK